MNRLDILPDRPFQLKLMISLSRTRTMLALTRNAVYLAFAVSEIYQEFLTWTVS